MLLCTEDKWFLEIFFRLEKEALRKRKYHSDYLKVVQKIICGIVSQKTRNG